MTLNEYQTAALSTSLGTVIGHPIVYPTLGLAGEAGEFAGKVKKLFRDGDLTNDRHEALQDELGDVLWYVAEIASRLGVTLDSVAARNVAKLASRKARGTIKGSGDKR